MTTPVSREAEAPRPLQGVDLAAVTTLLCDADGNLFPSEEPAFDASAEVTNRFMARFGLPARFTPTELRLATTGKNFRTTAVDLAVAAGLPVEAPLAARHPPAAASPADLVEGRALTVDELEYWVSEEKRHVTTHLAAVLRPDDDVLRPLTILARRYALAAVSSSATHRLDACFTATDLDRLFPADRRFSAEDSLPVPVSKPDPAVYAFAGARLAIDVEQGLAVEDSVPGARSAVAAGYRTVGNVMFVPPAERAERTSELRAAGVVAVLSSWWELVDLLADEPRPPTGGGSVG